MWLASFAHAQSQVRAPRLGAEQLNLPGIAVAEGQDAVRQVEVPVQPFDQLGKVELFVEERQQRKG